MAVDFLLHPLDTMKTRVQAMARGTRTFRAVVGPHWRSTCVGIFTNVAALPSGVAYFAVYESVKTRAELVFHSKTHVFLAHLVAGSLAEVSSIIVRYARFIRRNPFEVVKQQMQVGLDGHMVDALKHIYSSRGFAGSRSLLGYYAGFWSFVWREVPFSAIMMPFYELLRSLSLRKRKVESELTFFDNATNAAFAGIIGNKL